MGAIAERLEKHGVQLSGKEKDPLGAIVRRLVKTQADFPLAGIRKKHYNPDGELRTEMDEITGNTFEEAKAGISFRVSAMKVLLQRDFEATTL